MPQSPTAEPADSAGHAEKTRIEQMQDSAKTTTAAEPKGEAAELARADLERAGRHAVRTLFWDRLDEAGVKRPKGLTVEAYAALRDRLTDRLSYMAAPNLVTLAQLMIDAAQGPWRDKCPDEVVIWNHAKAIQRPPIGEHPIYTSWVRSIEGPPALAGGYLLELAEFVVRFYRAPTDYDLAKIKEAAAANARRLYLTQDRAARGVAPADDLQWASWYVRERDRLAGFVADGMAHRAALVAAQSAPQPEAAKEPAA
jgi:hypothetical protein